MDRRTLAILYLTIFIDLLCVGMVIPVLPGLVVGDLGESESMVGWMAALVPFSQLLFAPIWGSLSDRFGRKKILEAGILFNIAGALMFAATDSLMILAISRLLTGIGSSNYAVAQAYVSDVSQPEIRTKNIGIISSAIGLAFIIGPSIGALVKFSFGIRGLGLLTTVLALLNFIFVREKMPDKRTGSDLGGHRNFLRGLLDLSRTRNTAILLLLYLLFMAAFSMMQISSPLLWKDIYGLDERQIGYMFSLIGLCSVFTQAWLIGKIRNYMHEKWMVLTGILTMIPALYLFPNLSRTEFGWQVAAVIFLFALSNGLVVPSINTLLSRNSDKKDQGMALGTLQSSGALARIFGPACSGYLFIMDFRYPFYSGCLLLLICLMTGFLIRKEDELSI